MAVECTNRSYWINCCCLVRGSQSNDPISWLWEEIITTTRIYVSLLGIMAAKKVVRQIGIKCYPTIHPWCALKGTIYKKNWFLSRQILTLWDGHSKINCFFFFFTNRSFKGTSGMMFVSHKRSTFTQETAVRVQWATKSKQYVYFLRVAGSTASFTSISIDFTVLHSGRTGRYCTCCGSELTEAQARSSAEAPFMPTGGDNLILRRFFFSPFFVNYSSKSTSVW